MLRAAALKDELPRDLRRAAGSTEVTGGQRVMAGLFGLLVVPFAAQWLSQLLLAMAARQPLPAQAILALDLAFVLLLTGLTAWLLWRGHTLGDLIAIPRAAQCLVHSRVRGEHLPEPGESMTFYGSSPRARGTHARPCGGSDRPRLIPACAGNTCGR